MSIMGQSPSDYWGQRLRGGTVERYLNKSKFWQTAPEPPVDVTVNEEILRLEREKNKPVKGPPFNADGTIFPPTHEKLLSTFPEEMVQHYMDQEGSEYPEDIWLPDSGPNREAHISHQFGSERNYNKWKTGRGLKDTNYSYTNQSIRTINQFLEEDENKYATPALERAETEAALVATRMFSRVRENNLGTSLVQEWMNIEDPEEQQAIVIDSTVEYIEHFTDDEILFDLLRIPPAVQNEIQIRYRNEDRLLSEIPEAKPFLDEFKKEWSTRVGSVLKDRSSRFYDQPVDLISLLEDQFKILTTNRLDIRAVSENEDKEEVLIHVATPWLNTGIQPLGVNTADGLAYLQKMGRVLYNAVDATVVAPIRRTIEGIKSEHSTITQDVGSGKADSKGETGKTLAEEEILINRQVGLTIRKLDEAIIEGTPVQSLQAFQIKQELIVEHLELYRRNIEEGKDVNYTSMIKMAQEFGIILPPYSSTASEKGKELVLEALSQQIAGHNRELIQANHLFEQFNANPYDVLMIRAMNKWSNTEFNSIHQVNALVDDVLMNPDKYSRGARLNILGTFNLANSTYSDILENNATVSSELIHHNTAMRNYNAGITGSRNETIAGRFWNPPSSSISALNKGTTKPHEEMLVMKDNEYAQMFERINGFPPPRPLSSFHNNLHIDEQTGMVSPVTFNLNELDIAESSAVVGMLVNDLLSMDADDVLSLPQVQQLGTLVKDGLAQGEIRSDDPMFAQKMNKKIRSMHLLDVVMTASMDNPDMSRRLMGIFDLNKEEMAVVRTYTSLQKTGIRDGRISVLDLDKITTDEGLAGFYETYRKIDSNTSRQYTEYLSAVFSGVQYADVGSAHTFLDIDRPAQFVWGDETTINAHKRLPISLPKDTGELKQVFNELNGMFPLNASEKAEIDSSKNYEAGIFNILWNVGRMPEIRQFQDVVLSVAQHSGRTMSAKDLLLFSLQRAEQGAGVTLTPTGAYGDSMSITNSRTINNMETLLNIREDQWNTVWGAEFTDNLAEADWEWMDNKLGDYELLSKVMSGYRGGNMRTRTDLTYSDLSWITEEDHIQTLLTDNFNPSNIEMSAELIKHNITETEAQESIREIVASVLEDYSNQELSDHIADQKDKRSHSPTLFGLHMEVATRFAEKHGISDFMGIPLIAQTSNWIYIPGYKTPSGEQLRIWPNLSVDIHEPTGPLRTYSDNARHITISTDGTPNTALRFAWKIDTKDWSPVDGVEKNKTTTGQQFKAMAPMAYGLMGSFTGARYLPGDSDNWFDNITNMAEGAVDLMPTEAEMAGAFGKTLFELYHDNGENLND